MSSLTINDNYKLKKICISFLSHYGARNKFNDTSQSCHRNPWCYQNYLDLIRTCLEDIKSFSEELKIENQKDFSETILSRAHIVGDNPVGYVGEKTFQYRNATVEAGKELCSSFESLCMRLRVFSVRIKLSSFNNLIAPTEEICRFSESWTIFEDRLLKDKRDAENFFKKASGRIPTAP